MTAPRPLPRRAAPAPRRLPHGPAACAACIGEAPADCPRCHGTGREPDFGTGVPATWAAATVAAALVLLRPPRREPGICRACGCFGRCAKCGCFDPCGANCPPPTIRA